MKLAVEARGLTKWFGGRVMAVDRLDLLVRRGETYGLADGDLTLARQRSVGGSAGGAVTPAAAILKP